MKYGKLIDGALSWAPKGAELEGGAWQIPPSAEWLKANGYVEVEETPMPEPEPNCSYSFEWTEKDGKIVRVWTSEYIEPEYSESDRLAALEEAFDEFVAMMMEGVE